LHQGDSQVAGDCRTHDPEIRLPPPPVVSFDGLGLQSLAGKNITVRHRCPIRLEEILIHRPENLLGTDQRIGGGRALLDVGPWTGDLGHHRRIFPRWFRMDRGVHSWCRLLECLGWTLNRLQGRLGLPGPNRTHHCGTE
jgi:hypothetical protein